MCVCMYACVYVCIVHLGYTNIVRAEVTFACVRIYVCMCVCIYKLFLCFANHYFLARYLKSNIQKNLYVYQELTTMLMFINKSKRS
jgi:hypothetical protein